MAAVGLVLLIACGNIAGLLVARNAARHHELGTRAALGASRGRLVRQLLTESLLLAAAGAVPGVLLAIRGSNLLLGLMPPDFGPVSVSVSADWRVLGFALAATVATTLLFGLIPAWQSAQLGAAPALNRANPRSITTRVQFGRALVVAQFALSVVLVAGALLFVRTILNLARVETGFDRDHVLLVRMDPQGTTYEGERLRALQREMLEALARLPGVEHVTVATSSPFNGNIDGRRLRIPGVEPRDPDDGVIQVNMVGPEYFEAFRIPILRGRPIDARDQPNAPRVAVVSEGFARRYFAASTRRLAAASAPGARARSSTKSSASPPICVTRICGRRPSAWPTCRGSRAPKSGCRHSSSWCEPAGTRRRSSTRCDTEIQRLRPDAPILAIRTMAETINGRLLSERVLAALGSFFAIAALTLAAIGVYGLLAHLVARRVPEIGVRLALGARPAEMMWATLRDNAVMAVIGGAIGLTAAFIGLRVLDGLLFGLAPTDVVTLVSAALILMLVSLAAAFLPARRAASVDPLVALRYE